MGVPEYEETIYLIWTIRYNISDGTNGALCAIEVSHACKEL